MTYFKKNIKYKKNNLFMNLIGILLAIKIYTFSIDKLNFPIYYFYFPMLIILFFYVFLIKKKFEFKRIFLILFPIIYLFFSSFISQGKYISFRYTIFFTVFILLALILSKFDNWHNTFINSIMFISYIFVIVTIFAYFFNDIYIKIFFNLFSNESKIVMKRFMRNGAQVGLTNQTANNGFLISIGLSLLLAKIGKQKGKIFFYLSILLYILALLMTLKRSFIIANIIAFLFVYYIEYKFSGKKIKKMFLFIFGISLLIIILLIIQSFFPIINVMLERFTLSSNLNNFSSGRFSIYSSAIQLFKENPVFGTGINTGAFILDNRLGGWKIQQVHNVYIQLLMELGLIGTFIFLFVMILVFLKSYKILKKYYFVEKEIVYKLKVSIYVQTFWLIYCFFGNPFTTYTFLVTYFLFSAIPMYYIYRFNEEIINV